jgi:lysophospholipase L1-like esterase
MHLRPRRHPSDRSSTRPRASVPALALATVLVAVAGCSSSSDGDAPAPATATTPSPSPSDAPAPASRTYVALGDSYTAGPGIAPLQDNAGLCQRSAGNWPTLVARSLDLALTDVSCSGAATSDLSTTVGSGVVPPDTALVTVSAGGNDGGLFLSLIRACTASAQQCSSYVDDEAPPILDRATADLVALLDRTRRAAPDAQVVLVGYPRIMPTSGTCAAVGIPEQAVTSVVTAETALDSALAAAGEQAGVEYVSLREPSEGHDACAGTRAWTNGIAPAADDGVVFHPNAPGMAAVADRVAAAVG